MYDKLKVVLLCHYWSKEAEDMVPHKHHFHELSPWIQERINLFKDKDDIELHIVSPNYTSNKTIEEQKDGIYFHFYHYAPSLLSLFCYPFVRLMLKHDEPYKISERIANTITKFGVVKKCAGRIIDSINPDILHVFGTEMPDSSAGAVTVLRKYPVVISIQGYAYKTTISNFILDRMFRKERIKFEKLVNTNAIYKMGDYETDDFKPFENGQIRIVSGGNITRVPKVDATKVQKVYDVSFFGRVSADKGVEDLVRALGLLSCKGLYLKTIIIGKCTSAYQKQLLDILQEYTSEPLLDFSGFVEDHEDVYKIAASSIMVALPTRVDLMPNTIREAIAMGLPVVTSDAGFITTLNNDQESVAIHHVENVEELASAIKKVYQDKDYREMLISNGRKTFQEQYSMENVYKGTIEAYKKIYDLEKMKSR